MQSLGQYIKQVEYKPFETEDAEERTKKQQALGLGNVAKYVAPKMHGDASYEDKAKANKLAKLFDVVHLRHMSDEEYILSPNDDVLVINNMAIPMFNTKSNHDGYPNPREWDQVLYPQLKYINSLQAERWGCKEADYTINPPKWSAAVFPIENERASKITKIFYPMHDDLEKELREKELKKLKKEYDKLCKDNYLAIKDKGLWEFKVNTVHKQMWEEERKAYFWMASLPEIPSPVLELAERARKISDNGQFMLIYQPNWKIENEIRNLFDPILLLFQPIKKEEGFWFKIAEWGGDYLEEVQ